MKIEKKIIEEFRIGNKLPDEDLVSLVGFYRDLAESLSCLGDRYALAREDCELEARRAVHFAQARILKSSKEGTYMANYSKFTDDEYDSILHELADRLDGEQLLAIPGIYDILKKHYKDIVNEIWEKRNPDKAFPLEYEGEILFVCQNCRCAWLGDEMTEVADYENRVRPNEEIPAGDCPECGGLCYEKSKD